MTDIVDRATRSRMMSGIQGKNTLPERLVRSALHRAGLRFRLHDGSLPGRPDLVLQKWRAVIFVNGCFWHRHAGCKYATTPASNRRFWNTKFAGTIARDTRVRSQLRASGWRVLTVWECQARREVFLAALPARIRQHSRKETK